MFVIVRRCLRGTIFNVNDCLGNGSLAGRGGFGWCAVDMVVNDGGRLEFGRRDNTKADDGRLDRGERRRLFTVTSPDRLMGARRYDRLHEVFSRVVWRGRPRRYRIVLLRRRAAGGWVGKKRRVANF